jgi:hypothetical protein
MARFSEGAMARRPRVPEERAAACAAAGTYCVAGDRAEGLARVSGDCNLLFDRRSYLVVEHEPMKGGLRVISSTNAKSPNYFSGTSITDLSCPKNYA